MKKYIFLALLPLLFTGCVTKMIGGAVSVATFGLVKNEKTEHAVFKKLVKEDKKAWSLFCSINSFLIKISKYNR